MYIKFPLIYHEKYQNVVYMYSSSLPSIDAFFPIKSMRPSDCYLLLLLLVHNGSRRLTYSASTIRGGRPYIKFSKILIEVQ